MVPIRPRRRTVAHLPRPDGRSSTSTKPGPAHPPTRTCKAPPSSKPAWDSPGSSKAARSSTTTTRSSTTTRGAAVRLKVGDGWRFARRQLQNDKDKRGQRRRRLRLRRSRPTGPPPARTTPRESPAALCGLVKGRQVIHNNDPLLSDDAAAASKLKVSDGWRFARRQTGHDEPGNVDAIYAFAGAVQLALLMPEPRRAKVRLLSA